MSRALEALLDYRQADEDGVMVVTSRQAIHEVVDELKRLTAERDSYEELYRGEKRAFTAEEEKCKRLTAENERYRESLGLIASIDLDDPQMTLRQCVHHACGELVLSDAPQDGCCHD